MSFLPFRLEAKPFGFNVIFKQAAEVINKIAEHRVLPRSGFSIKKIIGDAKVVVSNVYRSDLAVSYQVK